jgi:hypothetical protein
MRDGKALILLLLPIMVHKYTFLPGAVLESVFLACPGRDLWVAKPAKSLVQDEPYPRYRTTSVSGLGRNHDR